MLKQKRKEALNKHGVIPEFIKISEVYQIYTAFTQANLKNSILHQRQALENAKNQPGDIFTDYSESELKEDLVII